MNYHEILRVINESLQRPMITAIASKSVQFRDTLVRGSRNLAFILSKKYKEQPATETLHSEMD